MLLVGCSSFAEKLASDRAVYRACFAYRTIQIMVYSSRVAYIVP
jgi:hypothetical protein